MLKRWACLALLFLALLMAGSCGGGLPAPTGLDVRAIPEGNALRVSWDEAADLTVAGYKLYVSDDNRSYDVEATLDADTTSYRHTGLTDGVTYYYRVSAFDEAGNESPLSSPERGIPADSAAPAAPTGLTVKRVPGENALDVSWNANSEADLAGYRLYVSTNDVLYNLEKELAADTTSFRSTGLTYGQLYYYKVSALDEVPNESDLSPAASDTPSAVLVPGDADLVASIQLSSIWDDRDVADLWEMYAAEDPYAPQTWRAYLDLIEDETGIDPRDFTEAIFFADISDLIESSSYGYEGVPYLGVLVKGTFDEQDLIRSIEGQSGEEFETSSYKDQKVYTYVDPYTDEEQFSICFLGEGLMAIGSVEAVEDVIAVESGDKEPISGEVWDAYNRLGDALVKVASDMPSSLVRQIPATAAMGGFVVSLRSLQDLDVGGYALYKEGSTLTIKMETHFTDPASAEDVRDLLDSLIGLSSYGVPIPEVRALLDKVELAARDSWLSIDFGITIEEIKGLVGALAGY